MDKLLEGQTLRELLEPLPLKARKFILMRLVGVQTTLSLHLLELNDNGACVWRANNPYFKDVERYVLSKPARFQKQALRLWFGILEGLSIIILQDILLTGTKNFNDLNAGGKRVVMQAMAVLPKLSRAASLDEWKAAGKEANPMDFEDFITEVRENEKATTED